LFYSFGKQTKHPAAEQAPDAFARRRTNSQPMRMKLLGLPATGVTVPANHDYTPRAGPHQ
jgi:hypothetical protein